MKTTQNGAPGIWFSADSHFGHRNIIHYCDRPFSSVEEMDRSLICNWNEVVGKDDIVYHLGDFSLDFNITRQVVPLLNGQIHLVCGNHDACHSSNRGAGAYLRKYLAAGFADVVEEADIAIGSERVRLCHLPYYDPFDEDERLPEYKPEDDGSWLLHGHVHCRWKSRDRQINLVVDVWDFYPVSLPQIAALIEEIDGKDAVLTGQSSFARLWKA